MPRKSQEVDSDVDYFIDPLISAKMDERSDITDGMPECTDDQDDDNSDMPTSVRSAQTMPEYDADEAPQELICCVHGFPCESTTNSPSSHADHQHDQPSIQSHVINISASKYGCNSRFKKQSYDPWTDPSNSEVHPNLNASAASYPSNSNIDKLITSVGSTFSSDSEHSGENEPSADYMVLGVNEQSPNLVTENPRRRRNKLKKMEQVQEKANQTRAQKENSYLRYYLGPMTRSEAEKHCIRPTSFYLYHRVPSLLKGYKSLQPQLNLYFVYCTSQGEHRHYRIKERTMLIGFGNTKEKRRQLCVRVRDEQSPYFSSLEALVHYYSTYSHLTDSSTSGGQVDVFPWWLQDKKKSKKADADELSVSPNSIAYPLDPDLLD